MLNRFSSTPQQQQYIKKCLQKDLRIDGRKNNQYRDIVYKHSNLQHIPGSAYSYINYQDVEIYVGVKAKIQKKKLNIDIQDIVRLQLSCMQKLDDQENQQMTLMERMLQKNYVNRVFQEVFQDKQIKNQLTIPDAQENVLVIYIDVFLLANPHISQLQLIQKTIDLALNHTQIPDLKATTNQVTKQEKIQILQTSHQLKINESKLKILLVGIVNKQSANKFGQVQKSCQFLLDLSRQEYEAIDKVLQFVIDGKNQKVLEMQILKGKINANEINKCISFVIGQSQSQ